MAEIGSSQNLKSNLTHGKWGISSSARVLKTFANDYSATPIPGNSWFIIPAVPPLLYPYILLWGGLLVIRVGFILE